MMKQRFFLLLLVLLLPALTGCDAVVGELTGIGGGNEIVFAGDRVTLTGSGASAEGCSVTIHQGGTYTLSGRLYDGRLTVETAGSVTLILAGVDMTCTTFAPIYIKQAEKVTVQLKDGTENTLTDGAEYVYADGQTEPDAALFSECDLTLSGGGSLTVNANYAQGILTKDDLTVDGGVYTVRAATHAIKGKDRVYINGGTLNLSAGSDGIKSTNKKDPDKGKILIRGGDVTITCGDDGLSAVTIVRMTGGSLTVDTANNGIKADGQIDLQGGVVDIKTEDKGLNSPLQTGSASAKVTVNGQPVVLN